MFCYQCEQTTRSRRGDGCANTVGTCGKDAPTSDLQDLLIYLCKGISMYAHRAAELGARDRDVDVFVIESLFTTLTNVNFDPARFTALIGKATAVRERARACYELDDSMHVGEVILCVFRHYFKYSLMDAPAKASDGGTISDGPPNMPGPRHGSQQD